MPMLSVVITVYNIEKYLRKCLDSVLNQRYTDMEIIIVDDGSEDGCSDICDKYKEKDSRVKVIHEKNSGSVRARKTGASFATGKYISFIDGDDWLDSTMYYDMMNRLIIENADMIIAGYIEERGNSYLKKNEIQSGIYRNNTLQYVLENALSTGKFYSPGIIPALWNKIFKREMISNIEMMVDDAICIGDDAAVTYPLIEQSSCIIVANDIQAYHYRILQGSLSRTIDDQFFFRTKKLIDGLKNHLITEEFQNSLNYYVLFMVELGLKKILDKRFWVDYELKKNKIDSVVEMFDLNKIWTAVDQSKFKRGEIVKWNLLVKNKIDFYICFDFFLRICDTIICGIKYSEK